MGVEAPGEADGGAADGLESLRLSGQGQFGCPVLSLNGRPFRSRITALAAASDLLAAR